MEWQELLGKTAASIAPWQCSLQAKHPWAPRRALRGGEGALHVPSKAAWFVSWEMILGQPHSRCYWYPSLNLFVLKTHIQKPSPSAWLPSASPFLTMYVFTWCLWFMLHHLRPRSFPGIVKTIQILLTTEICRDFYHFALVGGQNTP